VSRFIAIAHLRRAASGSKWLDEGPTRRPPLNRPGPSPCFALGGQAHRRERASATASAKRVAVTRDPHAFQRSDASGQRARFDDRGRASTARDGKQAPLVEPSERPTLVGGIGSGRRPHGPDTISTLALSEFRNCSSLCTRPPPRRGLRSGRSPPCARGKNNRDVKRCHRGRGDSRRNEELVSLANKGDPRWRADGLTPQTGLAPARTRRRRIRTADSASGHSWRTQTCSYGRCQAGGKVSAAARTDCCSFAEGRARCAGMSYVSRSEAIVDSDHGEPWGPGALLVAAVTEREADSRAGRRLTRSVDAPSLSRPRVASVSDVPANSRSAGASHAGLASASAPPTTERSVAARPIRRNMTRLPVGSNRPRGRPHRAGSVSDPGRLLRETRQGFRDPGA